ncbi:YybH family protein [Archangium lansingense]|uniref:Nuclear transport factor 2 family protein n=1 Tax=Archangium lansingense TaxID=2995310 RepID=A0ABT4ADF5_9BACT|nr:nuclear transport factor 2 family protein [Archangium lansinium]MCY1078939.1 nuclear transport factor 2 family protein [Archangium lansinium]
MRTIQFLAVLVAVIGIQGSSEAAEPCCDTETTRAAAELRRSDERAILRAVEGYAKGFIEEDMGMLLGLWDTRGSEEVTYVANEFDQPLVGLDELRPYYQSFLDTLIILSGDVSNVRISRRGDTAYVFCNYSWVYKTRTGGEVLVQPSRATFVLRKHGGRWLYQHFHESITFDYEPPTTSM